MPPLPPPDTRSPHSLSNRMLRVAWAAVWLVLFRPSPRPLHRWRNWLLRAFGARLHPTARVFSSARVWAPWNLSMGERSMISEHVDVYCVAPVSLGDRANVSQYSNLCAATHDYTDPTLPLVPMPITIGSDTWIAADVFVAPGVTIADGVVVGARSSVFKSLPPFTVCVGSPARPIKQRSLSSNPSSAQ